MKNHKNIYFILGIILIVFISFFLFREFIFKSPEENLTKDEGLKILKQIFPRKSIILQDDKNHYVIEGKDYYVKKIGDLNKDNFNEFVVMEIIKGEKRTHSFYSIDSSFVKTYLLIDNIDNFEWYSGNEEYKSREIDLSFKDITSDGIDEIFVPYEKNAKNNRWYQILTFDEKNKKLVKILEKHYQEEKPTEIIGFDEIEKEGDFVVMTWHGTYSKGKSYYFVEENILNFEKGVGAYGNPDIEGEYEYREIDKEGNVVYKETRKGSVWTDSLSR